MKKSFALILIVICIFNVFTVLSFAKQDPSKGEPLDWLKEAESEDMFEEVTDAAKNIGYSGYTLGQLVGRIILQVVMTAIAVTFMMKRKAADVKDSKEWLGNVVLGALLLFGLNFLITTLYSIALKIV
ncbi:hypothetical protein [Wukongibacter baidiensis]